MKQDFTIWRNQILQNPQNISPLKFGISQDEIIEIFGNPDVVSTMRSDGKPLILKYHDIELHFDRIQIGYHCIETIISGFLVYFILVKTVDACFGNFTICGNRSFLIKWNASLILKFRQLLSKGTASKDSISL